MLFQWASDIWSRDLRFAEDCSLCLWLKEAAHLAIVSGAFVAGRYDRRQLVIFDDLLDYLIIFIIV